MSEKKFEDALLELEKIVTEMESEGLGLDDSIKKYESGIKLATFCRAKLDQAEKKIEILTRKPDGTVDLKDFSDNASDENDNDSEQVTVKNETEVENTTESENSITTDEIDESAEIKEKFDEPENTVEVSKLSDSIENEENSEENIADVEPVVAEKEEPVVCEANEEEIIEEEIIEEEIIEEEIIEEESAEIEPDNEASLEETAETKETTDDKFDDNEAIKPKKVREIKPQKQEETFEDLLF